ncbi:MAG: glycerate kinase [Desulfobacter sp.]|nr:MAG: glycerate kinase [Desulfobacter sp.]
MAPLTLIAAPNAFKGSLTPDRAALAMAEGINKIHADIKIIKIPVSDGGDDLIPAMAGQMISTRVNDPRQRPIQADFLFNEKKQTAVIEMALASGLALLPPALQDPLAATTLGTGELIRAALDKGAKKIVLGIGGSATCDGGMGAAMALGYQFFDTQGAILPPVGASMIKVAKIDRTDLDSRIHSVQILTACDVKNPLTGPMGAARIFGPQKGASKAQVESLDKGLEHLGQIISKDLGIDIFSLKGAGAAGGLGGGIKAFFNGDLVPGIDLVLDLVEFKQHLKKADLVLTAEGQMDEQTRFNKAPAGVARQALAQGVPCIALCGGMGDQINELHDLGIDAVFSICNRPLSLDRAKTNAFELLSRATQQAVRAFLAGRKSI